MKKNEEVGQLTSSKELKNIFEGSFSQQLIDEEIVHAFGYGSGVFSQEQQQDGGDDDSDNGTDLDELQKHSANEKEERKMLDMILIVNDATKFHSLNQQLNPHHYAPLFRTSPTRAAWWQQGHVLPKSIFGINPGVFFNFVDDAKCWMKYGVMTRDDLAADLMNWDSLYAGGRLHKPTATIYTSRFDDNTDNNGDSGGMDILRLQRKHNLPAAVSVALLLASASPPTRNHNADTPIASSSSSLELSELYSHISGLSYTGDFRMQMGAEDPGKINKLVHSPGQLARFHALYYETAVVPLLEMGIVTSSSSSSSPSPLDTLRLTWNPSDPSVVKHLWRQLPPRFQCLPQAPTTPPRQASGNNHTKISIGDKDLQNIRAALNQELHNIVAPAARYQSFKGLWTAGLGKSAKYAFAKLSKGILRQR